MSLSLSVLSQSGPPKSVGLGGGREGRGGRIPHFMWSILYKGGNFIFVKPRVKLDGVKLDGVKSRNRLRVVSKFRNFWLCVFSGVVATTL